MEALIIIDVQNDYFKGGSMELSHTDEALSATLALQQHFQKQNKPIIYIQHLNATHATFFRKNTTGARIHPKLASKIKDDENIVTKTEPDMFQSTNLQSILNELKISQLLIVGMMTHMCVDTSCRRAYSKGYEVTICEEAIATCDLSFNDKKIKAADVNIAYLAALSRFSKIKKLHEII